MATPKDITNKLAEKGIFPLKLPAEKEEAISKSTQERIKKYVERKRTHDYIVTKYKKPSKPLA